MMDSIAFYLKVSLQEKGLQKIHQFTRNKQAKASARKHLRSIKKIFIKSSSSSLDTYQ